MTAPHDEGQRDPAGDQRLDVVVVGGSQAGLAMAWHLAQQGRRFVVLEAAPELGHTWRSRWDSLKLFTPAQYDALPGMAFPAPADTYPTKDPVADYLQAYAAAFDLPVRLNAQVTDLRRVGDDFEVGTADATYQARQVVDILFDVSNPGLWMAHCHIAEHMQSGMMFSFNVARDQAAVR